ncbi:5-methyltetrahydropteroyltriglutamate--homocysteine methyltransferase [Cardiosporidium cionae]|uniref:5-methyltetrahydropteroyltriglutamate--homocysteine S-methyltransferase n=1 Tax=Cardiosporidium cionae TaxID=476202 RepID=A0ABQ7J9U8_9APIC|nr:5-methyltetrahydropteroyltriglutamate--homocysteine methyltransferase [Cardiosporidium cionae]|eukprot:KAF8820740.1 5-methyltetrahydropteroyltriglutamate--homocysteine methyltransferase [Cardiosporidium cionae]
MPSFNFSEQFPLDYLSLIFISSFKFYSPSFIMALSSQIITLGYPRIGANREIKKALESYWSKKVPLEDLLSTSKNVAYQAIEDQAAADIDVIGVGGHTLYDQVLDWTLRFGLIPSRFEQLRQKHNLVREDLYFAMARGREDVGALDMTKWFDTNYHNMTPEISRNTLEEAPSKADFTDFFLLVGANRVGAEILGPLTLVQRASLDTVTIEEAVDHLAPLYMKILQQLKVLGVKEVHMHEPSLVLELYHSEMGKKVAETFYRKMGEVGIFINLVTYYDDLGAAYPWIVSLEGVSAVSLDFTRGNNLELLKLHGFPSNKRLGAGVVDARSVWDDIEQAKDILQNILKEIPTISRENLAIQPSCSLMHVPVDVTCETGLPDSVKQRLRFARQKLVDLKSLSGKIVNGGMLKGKFVTVSESENVEPEDALLVRSLPLEQRQPLQLLPLKHIKLVTSTIGSFPQTDEMRKIRLKYRRGEVSLSEYENAVDDYIAYCVGAQEGIGLDIIVHGEPERSDMVEYFAEKMDGFLFTQNGWVQSYGSRYVRPPIIYDDIKRKNNAAMTVREYLVAARHTKKPVKGMLTGPVTILNWSFPRKDISRKAQCYQIGTALRNEVADLEAAGCTVIQVDEPALREGLPLRSARHEEYLRWAVRSFRLSTSVVRPETHIVTHFCYSEFGDVLDAIRNMDADQITIENSRSDNAMLKEFLTFGFSNILAPGVYDVHSPVIPAVNSLVKRMRHFLESGLPVGRFFVVPDCGLKTRKWEEVIPSLRNVVQAVYCVRDTC